MHTPYSKTSPGIMHTEGASHRGRAHWKFLTSFVWFQSLLPVGKRPSDLLTCCQHFAKRAIHHCIFTNECVRKCECASACEFTSDIKHECVVRLHK